MITNLTKLLAAAMIAGLTSCAADPVATPVDARRDLSEKVAGASTLDVLFVGNSYSFHVPAAFAKEAERRGKNVKVEQLTHGGWTLGRHAESADTLEKIRSQKWDVVVFQEQSRIPSQAAMRAMFMSPNLKSLAAEARKQGAVPVLYQTWGYRDGDPKVSGDDFAAMTARVREGYRAAAKDAGGLFIVPVGDAWEREVAAGRGAALFKSDGSHPTAKANSLTAGVFADAFFKPGAN